MTAEGAVFLFVSHPAGFFALTVQRLARYMRDDPLPVRGPQGISGGRALGV